jgi:hypothetical protein
MAAGEGNATGEAYKMRRVRRSPGRRLLHDQYPVHEALRDGLPVGRTGHFHR